jgi:nucleoside-diphosphate-sugar epimerase
MRVVVIGATGNSGTSLLPLLAAEAGVDEVVGIARRRAAWVLPKVRWVAADMARDELVPHLRGADVLVHLAWRFQPERDPATLWRNNVEGTQRVLAAVAAAGVPALVYASSVAGYSPGPIGPAGKGRVGEDWPTNGIPTSLYSRQKAALERSLDRFENQHPGIRVVRVRPGLVFKRDAATGIRRNFLGPLVPNPLVRPELIPVLPDVPGLRVQAVHADDLAAVYRAAVLSTAEGAFNVAAEPVLDLPLVAARLGARTVRVEARVLRTAVATAWRLRLEPTEPGWIDLGMRAPIMDSARAMGQLGWVPRWKADDAVLDLLEGIREGAGLPTPPLAPSTSGPLRLRELATGIGAR